MKRFLFAILTLIAFTATAQIEHSIVLDAKSFRAVQQDALTGVNIDPIGLDHSRQACARIKIKFDRMSKAQIDALEVKMRSNTDLTKQKVADYYDNVLILEMTAKPNTRFYFYSPEFGESNEVTLNLEGNREYEMLASLNQTFSIVVSSNTENVDIYLDDVFKGKTDSSKSLTIKEVMIGAHTLKAVYGTVSSQQSIEVNSGSILFRQNVDTAASRPQFVVFAVEPQSAVVTIDGKHYSLTDGAMRLVLESGTYNYTVSAAGYHSQSGTFTVAGSKVTKQIALTADAATVTLTVADNAEIWVNGEKVGNSRWSGTLNSGTYIFEAKKAGHSTTTTSKHITSDNPQQSYTLESPKPLFGSLIVDGSPLMADVAIDGVGVGQMPLSLDNLLVGQHKITVSKSGYQPYSATVAIAEGKTATVNAALTKQSTQTTSTSTQPTITKSLVKRGSITTAPYKIGDYYNENGKEGVVFEVWDEGRSGKIVSTVQATLYSQGDDLSLWGETISEITTFVGANDYSYGMSNQRVIQSRADWQKNYPVFKWCADLGEGWYLPAIDELIKLTLDDAVYQKVNRTLNSMGKTPLNQRGTKSIYISSTECRYASLNYGNTTKNHTHYYSCWYTTSLLKMYNFSIKLGITSGDVRAVAVFGDINSANRVVEPNFRDRKPTKAPYKVGDYYNENGKEGVVFEVGANGYSGKIVALNKIKSTSWCSDDKKCKKIVGASSRSDGEENMRAVQQQKKWREYYPAFAACADLGSGWYIPAINELNAIFAVKNKIDFTLVSKQMEQLHIEHISSDRGISSTESDSPTGIWYLFFYNSDQPRTSSMYKRLSGSVYPVSKF